MITAYHAKYLAHDLTLQHTGGGIDRLSQALFNASVDLNPHQIEAAVFALRSPLSKGVLLADEVGLGKTIEAGIVLFQFWAERKRQLPGLVDLGEVTAGSEGMTRIVLEAMQELLLKLALQMARDDYETRRERQRQGVELARQAGKYLGRRTDEAMHARIWALRAGGHSIAETGRLQPKPGQAGDGVAAGGERA